MNGLQIGSVAGVPVFVSGWYVVLIAYAALSSGDAVRGGLWVLCITISLLVHEFGHAFAARHFRLHPQILLHGFGGLCGHDRAERDLHDVVIISAGPAAGLVLGGVAFGVQAALLAAKAPVLANPIVSQGLSNLIFLNVFWSLVNLAPVWPLDGGQLFRLFLLRLTTPVRAERVTHWTGIALCIGVVASSTSYYLGTFGMLLAGLIAWENWKALRGDRASGPIRSRNSFARELLAGARAAFDAGDWHEAARLCHQIRSESRLPESVLAEVWNLLGIATANAGKHKEAVSYLKRARLDEAVGETWLRCLLLSEQQADAEELLASRDWMRLGSKGDAIVARVSAPLAS